MSDTAATADGTLDKPKKGSLLSRFKKAAQKAGWFTLKWGFRLAVLGIGVGAGSEFLLNGMAHGTSELSQYLLHSGTQFADPIMEKIGNWITGGTTDVATAMEPFSNFLKGIHESLGISGTFEKTSLGSNIAQKINPENMFSMKNDF